MKSLNYFVLSLILIPMLSCAQDESAQEEAPKQPDLVLVFTKTEGYRHGSIEKGVQTLRELGRANNFIALQTESSEDFNTENLKNYQLVLFLSTTLDVLDASQQTAFENYIKAGGAFWAFMQLRTRNTIGLGTANW